MTLAPGCGRSRAFKVGSRSVVMRRLKSRVSEKLVIHCVHDDNISH